MPPTPVQAGPTKRSSVPEYRDLVWLDRISHAASIHGTSSLASSPFLSPALLRLTELSREESELLTSSSFLANVRFRTTEEGGRRRAPQNPAISQLVVGGVQLSCLIVAVDEEGAPVPPVGLALGECYGAWVVLEHARYYASELAQLGREIEFREGPRAVAVGARLSEIVTVPEAIAAFVRGATR